MKTTSAFPRRFLLAGGINLLASPAIVGRAAAATRGVTDDEIVIGTMTDLSGVTAVAEAPGEPAEGFYSMAPALYRYPDDPKPAVRALTTAYRQRFGFDINYLGEAGYTCATFTVAALEKAGRDLTLDSFIGAMESMKDWHDVFGGPALSLSPTNHHASSRSFLSVVKSKRWTPVVEQPLSF